ncbi:hypothetical protein [Pilibacter termitis]|nr:hypothetical protein [Pilibacter termitis]
MRQRTIFQTAEPKDEMRFWAKSDGCIALLDGKMFVRTNCEKLTNKLQELYALEENQWFMEEVNLVKLRKVLDDFGFEIAGVAPFFIPNTEENVSLGEEIQFFSPEEILQFKEDKRFVHSFSFDEAFPDKLGAAFIEQGEMLAVAGASEGGRFAWEVGVELLSEKAKGRGIASKLVRAMKNKTLADYPENLLLYGTQFSHVKSMNVAIQAGFTIGFTEIRWTKKA